ncbi:MLO-like protein 1 [Canna indica]|uniref:MLO-like protein n=1 Tax=Canna indica TaxID=4628 RepID=A0AAQ3Q7V6_9LILI|nr:MLO-like protein 1 [Canna indica]
MGEITLEYTPTWIVTVVCSVLVLISILFERGLHRLGEALSKRNKNTLVDALQKIKEELMLLGFISLLLVVVQVPIQKICVDKNVMYHLQPCSTHGQEEVESSSAGAHFSDGISGGNRRILGGDRRLLSGGEEGFSHCMNEGKVPLLSYEAIHELHIFIFALAVTHVAFCLITVLLAGVQMRKWESWEEEIKKHDGNASQQVNPVEQFEFMRKRFEGFGADSFILSWLKSFFKQLYGSITNADYTTMRRGFIMTHCRGNPQFDFYQYMRRVVESDFRQVVGISWYLWIFVMIYLLLNIQDWHLYFWISFVPLILLLAIGTKLEHVISQLAKEVAKRHSAIEGDLVVNPSDNLFWFNNPRTVLYLIQFILFQNAYEIAILFWIFITYGFHSCIMDKLGFILTRLIISMTIQILCSYSTLPLYAIVTQMGSSFNKAIFDDDVRAGLVDWAKTVRKKNKKHRRSMHGTRSDESISTHSQNIDEFNSRRGNRTDDQV